MRSNTPRHAPSILARHLDRAGGRYALYPPPRAFRPDFDDTRFIEAVRLSNGDPIPRPLSLHFEIPPAYKSCFCLECGSGLPRDRVRSASYVQRLVREITLVGGLFDRDRDVVQVSLAPGTTRLLDTAQIEELLDSLSRHFHVPAGGGRDFALTVEPGTRREELRELNLLGFNRIGFGIGLGGGGNRTGRGPSDVDAHDTVAELVCACRDAGFSNVRVDLPYGAANQDQEAFLAILDSVLRAAPDRIGLRDCAHVSETSPMYRDRPSDATARATMLLAAVEAVAAEGYLHVGMDVFARAHDSLVLAQRRGQLHRDALGFGIHGETDLVGFGVGAISQIGGCHAQATLHLRDWEALIDAGRRAVAHGSVLSAEDEVRWDVIRQVLCAGRVCVAAIEERHRIRFEDYFKRELRRMEPLFQDGLMAWEQGDIVLDRLGRLAARVIAGGFDGYPQDTSVVPMPIRAQG